MSRKVQRWRLAHVDEAGLHEIDATAATGLCQAGRDAGLYCAVVDLGECEGKAAFLAALAEALAFPAWFGHNWDALADCLDDLDWLPPRGVMLVLNNTGRLQAQATEDYRVALEILAEAAAAWRSRGTPFWVFVTRPPAAAD